eukprot:Phypoly_transcript_22966.p1 GENE.Phypoly_transcript_22966~~Phypoly_transcript_22966.p1  ORF type:complete len:137 (+),score=28.37 Phypoly_transcript_22966:136-546(+)
MFKIAQAFNFSSFSHQPRKSPSAEFLPLNDSKEFEFMVVQCVSNGPDMKTYRRLLHVTEDGISIVDKETDEHDFISFFNIKKFFVSEDTTEWRILRHVKGGDFETLSFRSPRAGEIHNTVQAVIAKVVRDRRAMTM